MPGFSGGVFTRIYSWATDKTNSIRIRADRSDEELDAIATGLSTCVLKDGTQTMTANLPMAGFKITGLGTPTDGTDAVTKTYADGVATPAKRITARVATTANGTLASAFDDGSTVDGVTLATDDIILVKNQSAGAENGVYVVVASGAPTRHSSFNDYADHIGAIIAVTAGSTNANTLWVNMDNPGGTIDVTALTFAQSGSSIDLPVAIASGGTGQTSAALAFDALKQAASTTATGVVELATSAETQAGADTARAVTPAGGASAWEALGKFTALNTQTAAYTLVLTDAGKNVEVNSSSSRQVTIPANASVAFATNTYVNITRLGSGTVTVKGDTGVTLNGTSAGTITISTRYGGATIYKRGTNEWVAPNYTAT